MKIKAGLWIDHRQTNIVQVTGSSEEPRTIVSHVEKQLRRTGSRPLQGHFNPHQSPPYLTGPSDMTATAD